jgi:MFS family permease
MASIAMRLRESGATFAAAVRNGAVRRLLVATAGTVVGSWAYVIALGVYAYREDGAYAVGLVALVRWLVSGAAAPLAGVVGDRFRRVPVMVGSNAVRAAAIAGMAAVAALDGPSLAVYALSVVAALGATVFGPAEAALLPQVVRTPEELTAANVAGSTIQSAGTFVGPALGGFMLAAGPAELAFAVAAALSLWASLVVAGVEEPERQAAEAEEPGGVVAESLAGFRTIAREPRLRLFVALFTAQALVDGALSVLVVVLALETLDIGAAGVGVLNSAAGVGGLVGAVVAAALVGRGRLASDFGVGILLFGLPLLVVGLVPEPAVAIALFALVGLGNTLLEVSGDTLMQRSVPADVLARVFGALDSLLLVAVALGAAAAPVLATLFGGRGAAIAVGALLPAVAVLAWRRLVAIDVATTVPVRRLELLRAIPIFAPLSPPTVEFLAGRLDERRVEAGTTIVRQGEPGDDYYVVADGRVEVAVDGTPAGELGPGEGFGEIALLREVPRTATVTAVDETTLYALDREDFIRAVTGQPESAAVAESLVGARLGPARNPAPAAQAP